MLLEYARLGLDANGQPYSDHYHDIYYTPGAGFAESEHVFINGNRLHERFTYCHDHITIGEIGYGTGLNFIHTADTFLRDAPAGAFLHYISFERAPIAANTLECLQRNWPQPQIRAALARQNPHNHAGHHLLKIHPRIHLHLILGDIRDTLPELRARIDAWYLDGFAPNKNPECWSAALIQEVAHHSKAHASAATFSAARAVRDALTQAGFYVEKRNGYGHKRDMLTATLENPPTNPPHWSNQPAATSGDIAIIGAGIAGSTTARALAESGRNITLIHSDAHPAASHVPLAVPYLNPDNRGPNQTYQITAWHHAMRALHQNLPHTYHPCGIYCHAENDTERRRQQTLLKASLLNRDELRGTGDSLYYPRGGRIRLPELLAALADHPNIRREQHTINNLQQLRHYSTIILCCGWQSQLNPEPLLRDAIRPLRGQGSIYRLTHNLQHIHCDHRTLIPDGACLYSGASFSPDDSDLTPRNEDDTANLHALQQRLPDSGATLHSRFIGIRGASRDHMPLVGAIADSRDIAKKYAILCHNAHADITANIAHHPRLYMHQALGSKGCTQAWLNADILTALINATPLPLPQSQLERITPARYHIRALKRGQLR